MKKRLYCVTLKWDNEDEGDFCENVWATNEADAIRRIATIMSGLTISRVSRAERKKCIEHYIANAGPYAAVDVASTILSDLGQLFSGPNNKMTKSRGAAMLAVINILQKVKVVP